MTKTERRRNFQSRNASEYVLSETPPNQLEIPTGFNHSAQGCKLPWVPVQQNSTTLKALHQFQHGLAPTICDFPSEMRLDTGKVKDLPSDLNKSE